MRYGGDAVVEAPATGGRTVATIPLGPMEVQQGRHRPTSTYNNACCSRSERTLMHPGAWADAWVVSAEENSTFTGAWCSATSRLRQAWAVHELSDPTPASSAHGAHPGGGVQPAHGAGHRHHWRVRIRQGYQWRHTRRRAAGLAGGQLCVADRDRRYGRGVRPERPPVADQHPVHPRSLPHRGTPRHPATACPPTAAGGNPQATTVVSVALRCGLLHMGRFAQQYRASYGEALSATLSRSHRS